MSIIGQVTCPQETNRFGFKIYHQSGFGGISIFYTEMLKIKTNAIENISYFLFFKVNATSTFDSDVQNSKQKKDLTHRVL